MVDGREADVWRVLGAVLDGVRAGRWPAGSRLPSESTLAAEFRVKRPTVTKVAWLLRWCGLIVGRPGGASYVAEEPMRTLALQLVERAYEIRSLGGDVDLRGADPKLRRDCE